VTGRLLTTRELAELLGLSPATVLRKWRAGELPGFQLASNVLRFDPADVTAYLAERRRGPSSSPSGIVPGIASGIGEEEEDGRGRARVQGP
jgi:excisionase family DNA binding protein